MYFGNASELIPFAKDNRVRLIAVSTEKRMELLPDVPAVAETYPGFELTSWNGLIGPAGLPGDVVERAAQATIEAARDPEIDATLKKLGIVPIGDTPAQFRATIAKQAGAFDEAIDAAGLRMR